MVRFGAVPASNANDVAGAAAHGWTDDIVVGRWLPVAIVLLAASIRAGAAPAPDICKGDGSSLWFLRMADWDNAVAPAAPTQAGVDALRKKQAGAVVLQSLLLTQRGSNSAITYNHPGSRLGDHRRTIVRI